jgi:hypothetical protein
MATIQLTTNNYNGASGNVYFYPCNSNGSTTNLGTHTFPMEIVNPEQYEGTYQVQFTGLTSGNNQFCYVQIPCSDCNRPTGLTTTELFIQFSYTDGPFSGQTNTFSSYTAIDVCNVLNDLNNNLGFLSSSLFSQIGPDNTVYQTEILGDCSKISDGFFILNENGTYVVREISGGILSNIIDCTIFDSTPTPTPTPDAPVATATPTPTPTSASLNMYSLCGYGATPSSACFDASTNPKVLYSDCDSLTFGTGCTVYVDTFPNALIGYDNVFINEQLWDISSLTGVVVGLSSEQC